MDVFEMKKIADALIGPYPNYEIVNFYFNDQKANYGIVSHNNSTVYLTDDYEQLLDEIELSKNWVIYTF